LGRIAPAGVGQADAGEDDKDEIVEQAVGQQHCNLGNIPSTIAHGLINATLLLVGPAALVSRFPA
jgi:hypothetical protein